MSDGPKRMLEGLGEGSEDALLGKMLRSAQEDLPDAAMLSRIEAKLPSGGPTPPSGPTGASGPAGGAALSNTGLWMKLAGFLFATVAVIAIATRFAPSGAPEPVAELSTETTAAPILEYGPPWAGPEETSGSASEPAPEIVEPVAKKPSPRRSKPGRRARRVERRAPQQNGPAELRLIQAAQGALVKGEHARALVLTEKHRAEHPSGAFVQEREVIAISALLRSDRREEAKRRILAFEGKFPRSAHLRRLKVLLQKP